MAVFGKREDVALRAIVEANALIQRQLDRQIEALRTDNAKLQDRLAEKDKHYAALVERMTAPAPPAIRPVQHLDPEQKAVERMKDDTLERMAADFVANGMEPEDAKQHAAELARAAEALWGG